jgi:hypothetical protein
MYSTSKLRVLVAILLPNDADAPASPPTTFGDLFEMSQHCPWNIACAARNFYTRK